LHCLTLDADVSGDPQVAVAHSRFIAERAWVGNGKLLLNDPEVQKAYLGA
jgi:hypothetical protein